MKTCTEDACDKKVEARGLCHSHYGRARHAGLLGDLKPLFRGTTEDRLKHYSERQGECIVWTGAVTPEGYGKTRHEGKYVGTHRVAYELANGPIPEGMQIDHRCHNPRCFNLDHLRTATPKTNAENRQGAYSTNKTGFLGVSKAAGRNKFRSAVKHHGKTHFLGHFDTAEEAADVARAKRLELFTYNDIDRSNEES
jgi:hypothetical protein